MTANEWADLQVGQAVRNLGVSYRVVERVNGQTRLNPVRQAPTWSLWRNDDQDHRKWHRWPRDDAQGGL